MAINRAPFNALIDDDGSGLTGTVWNKAAIQGVLLDPIDALIGDWQQVPFDASMFSAVGANWIVNAGHIGQSAVNKVGPLWMWRLDVNGATIDAPTANLYLRIPFGQTISFAYPMAVAYANCGGQGIALGAMLANGTQLYLQRPDNSAIPAGLAYIKLTVMYG